ncbi:MAG: FxsA family protein [Acidimicrobiia bacterium]
MRFLAVFALIAVAEMATFFWVESRIGLGWALGLALATALIGSFLVKRSGLAVLSRIQEKLSVGQLPGRELSDGATVLVSGAFLISPGFLTDCLGFLLLVPAVRGLVYRVVSKRFLGRMTVFNVGSGTMRSEGPGTTGHIDDFEVIDVEELE